MSSPKDAILSKTGILQGKDSLMDGMVKSITSKLESGNSMGPPDFHYGPQPSAVVEKTKQFFSTNSSSAWSSIFIDGLTIKLGEALDIPGQIPLLTPFGIFDVTSLLPSAKIPFPIPPDPLSLANWVLANLFEKDSIEKYLADLLIPISGPKLLAEATAKLTELIALYAGPSLPILPVIPIISIPQLPGFEYIKDWSNPGLLLPGLFTSILAIPFDIFKIFFSDINKMLSLILDIKNLPQMLINLVFEAILNIPIVKNLLNTDKKPSLLISTILEIVKSITKMIGSVLIGSIMGAGSLSKGVIDLVGNLF